MLKIGFKQVCFFLIFILLVHNGVFSQSVSGINIDNLSDEEIRLYISQIDSKGLTDAQFESAAAAKGLSKEDIAKLKARGASVKGSSGDGQKGEREIIAGNKVVQGAAQDLAGVKSQIFGSTLFNNSNLTFEPSLKLPTPKNYILGPDDELIIDIWGFSEANMKPRVNPEGYIRLPNIGPVYVNGLTIEQASERIVNKLSLIYSGIKANPANTFALVSLGNIRSIHVTMVGNVSLPGTYTLPSLATVFNALYACGGPSFNGSFRAIEVIRNNVVIKKLDVYDFLLKGSQKDNIRLEDQDIIRVPPYKTRVSLLGMVKRPAVYEITGKESLLDVIDYADGFADEVYKAKAFVVRNTDTERKYLELNKEDFSGFVLQNGDNIVFGRIGERILGKVQISGAVFRPGDYQIENGLTLLGLIKKAAGVREDVFLPRALINRKKADLSSEIISVNLGDLLNKKVEDIPLKENDEINIFSKFDLRDQYIVTIAGEVKNPVTVTYKDNMSLEDLIINAGGLKEGATHKRVEVSRRIKDSTVFFLDSEITTQILQFEISPDLSKNDSNLKFVLQPFDQVLIRTIPLYGNQSFVSIRGEILYPGQYGLKGRNERISDLIKRSGGLLPKAYPQGANLIRSFTYTEAEKGLNLKKIVFKSSGKDNESYEPFASGKQFVAINLRKILKNPGSKYDIFLQNGDELSIPIQSATVKVEGEVLSPSNAIYQKGKRLKRYISNAGGFTINALRRKTFVVYPNGEIKRTRKILFVNHFPKIMPGSTILVSRKPEGRGFKIENPLGVASAFTSLALIIQTIFYNISR